MPCSAGVKVAVKRFLGGFDEAGFLTEDAAADQALSGVDPREAARRATDPINAIDIAAAGEQDDWLRLVRSLFLHLQMLGYVGPGSRGSHNCRATGRLNS